MLEGKLEFTYQFQESAPKITMTLSPQADLVEVIESFEQFLRGAGYAFDGTLDFVDIEVNEQA